MNFECLEILGLNQDCQFWGDNINYRNVQTFTARGRVSGDVGATSIVPAWVNMSGLMSYSSGYMPIYAQGVLLGTGKFTQISLDGDTDVRYKPFNVSFQILKSGDLSNVTGAIYSGLSGTFDFFPYLNSFTEEYQYSQENNLTVDFSRNINFGLEKGYTNQITGAHTLSSRILRSLADLGIYFYAIPSHFPGIEGVVRNISQSIDTINGNFSYSEVFSYQSGRAYVHEYQHSLNYEENGITTVTEQGSVQGNRRTNGTGDRMEYTTSGWAQVLTGIFSRVSGVFTRWASEFQSSGCFLDSTPYTKSVSKDYSRGLLSYNYSYNNDPASQSGYYHSYEQSLNINQNGWIDVEVGGELRPRQTEPTGALDFIYNIYTGKIRPNIPNYASKAYFNSLNYFNSPYCPPIVGTYTYGLLGYDGISLGFSGVPIGIMSTFNSSTYDLLGYDGVPLGYDGVPIGIMSGSTSGLVIDINLSLLNSKENYSDRPAKINYNFQFTDDSSYIATGDFRKIKNTITNQEITPLVNTYKLVNFKELPQNSFQSNLGLFTNNIEIIGKEGVSIDQYKLAASGRIVIPEGESWMVQNSYNYSPFENVFSMTVGYNYIGYREINNFSI